MILLVGVFLIMMNFDNILRVLKCRIVYVYYIINDIKY